MVYIIDITSQPVSRKPPKYLLKIWEADLLSRKTENVTIDLLH